MSAGGSRGSARRKRTTAADSPIVRASVDGSRASTAGRASSTSPSSRRARSASSDSGHSRATSAAGSSPSSGPRTTISPSSPARTVEVGRPQPRVRSQLAHAQVGHVRAEGSPSGDVAPGGGDDGDPPSAVPPVRGGTPTDVLGRLALQQAADEPVLAAVGRQLAGGDHAGEGGAHGAGRDPERVGQRDERPRRQCRRRQAEEDRQHERAGVERPDPEVVAAAHRR